MENRGTVNSEKGAPIPPQQRNTTLSNGKCSITLAKNMHVKLLNSICRTCFDFISIVADCLSMNRAYMAHTRKGCTLFRCRIMEGFFNIYLTLGSGHTPGVSILDSE